MNRKNQILTFTISTVLLVILSGTAFADVTVNIDIKPGSELNSINNNGKGVIPVAILGSDVFDVTVIEPSTVALEGCGIKTVGKNKLLAHYEDVNDDGYVDLVVQIVDVDGAFSGTTAELTGNLFEVYGGTPITGIDSIRLVPK